jgi:hypothetical protein
VSIRETLEVAPEQMIVASTGEVVDVQRVLVRTAVDMDFDKVWVAQLALAVELVGGAAVKVLTTLIKTRNAENMVILSQREISEKADVDKSTVNRTIRLLIDKGIVAQIRGGVYQLSPGMIWRGTHDHRMRVLVEYQREIAPPDAITAAEWADREVEDAQRRLEIAQRRRDATRRAASPSAARSPDQPRTGR